MRYSIELSPRQSARALDHAVRASAQIIVELPGNARNPVPGQLVSADDAVLIACLTRSPLPNPRALIGRYVDVQVFTDPRHYFTTHILRIGDPIEPNQLALQRPEVLQVIQRRRFWRAQLAPSSTVQLSWTTADGQSASLEAALLNLSADGLACRLPADDAADLSVGDRLDLRLDLPGAADEFEFTASLTNRTPAAEGAVILGVQFELAPNDRKSSAAQRRLRECLYNNSMTEQAASQVSR